MRTLLARGGLLLGSLSILSVSLMACGSSSDGDSGGSGSGNNDAGKGTVDGGGSGSGNTDSDGGSSGTMSTDTIARTADKLTAPDDTWTWVPLPNTRCANGAATGVGVNLHPGATKVVVYLEGGGACYDATTCYVIESAANFTSGYGAANFTADGATRTPLFTRSSTVAAWADASFVYVPYCTGDLHTGDGIAQYELAGVAKPSYHFGGHNIDVVVNAIKATYASLDRVWLAGSSAGGYGTVLNQDFFARGLGTRVDVVDDSGPAVNLPFGGSSSPPSSWSARLPPSCTNCTSLSTIQAFDRATYPTTRYGFLSWQTDSVLPLFYAVTDDSFATTLTTYEASLGSDANAHYLVNAGTGHTVLLGTGSSGGDVAVTTFVDAMTSDSTSWANIGP